MAFCIMRKYHRGMILSNQTPKLFGNAVITLLLPGATGTHMNTFMK
jgi:hypothetical protein